MKAVVISRPGSPAVLEIGDAAKPEPRPGSIRVRVRACYNVVVCIQRHQVYHKRFPAWSTRERWTHWGTVSEAWYQVTG
jgi:NADPH:quinone reductase-like Zn-dependent oxidoreductase